MGKPIVAVVGRPNVGKSTLFNRLAGERISIVEDTPGVTRDRIYADVEWLGKEFTIIDTGGIDPDAEDIITRQMMKQAEIAIETSDVVLFVVDVKTGITDADEQVANMLRKSGKPLVLAVNKVDDMRKANLDIYEFYSLGLSEPIPISAGQALGLGDMLDEVVKFFPETGDEEEDDETIKIAIVGKPNVGKSSIINRILGEDRLIVSDIPGTTRDAIDTPYEKDGHNYVFIDTAGMRRKSKIKENIEKYSIIRAIAAVERCDVCVLVINAEEGITDQDTKIAGIAHERGKAAIIAVNKWDAIEKDGKTMNKFIKDIDMELKYMPYAPKLFVSALTGQRIDQLFGLIRIVSENASLRIATGILNEVLIEAVAMSPPPTDKGKQLKIYFVTQVSVKPPTFVLFVNDTELMHFSYKRYIENQFRQAFGFTGTPIHFIVRNRKD
ncbi:ribosome biogenesis GTPase Der [Anaeropeptidivorans aminofermentans]|jgi:GTP-binding protein|uniref:ribosome biogenesis GTPase Der n=1 Tax=Anaeropeptidivorans aminofermentans TaxID=2934315 RepID=UPI0020250DEC|nr:ribosome biogenesis GTPase Der [Anaeropeptidivorans aminofermentans]